jgi:hypothetical protein
MKHTFTPAGGMNQDDSIVTPTKDYAGESAFSNGDYKYALNMRIGSSKKDNFGDGENIKDTLIQNTYWARAVVNSNPIFASGLTGWSQIGVSSSAAWTIFLGNVVYQAPVGASFSDILYQSITPSGKRMGFCLKLSVSGAIENSSCRLVFLNGSTILSTQDVFTDTTGGILIDHTYQKYLNFEIPSGCNRVGVQCYANSTVGGIIQAQVFQFLDWALSSRPAGTERVIGRKEDRENNLLYYCVYNASGNHSIRFYDPSTARNYTVLQWSGLNFAYNYFESMAILDNYLGITDRNNSPRLMDVWSVGDLYLILGSSEFREYHISFHKWAPIQPPVVKGYYDGVTDNADNFKNKCLQFSYRYIFQGNLKTRFSPVSNAAQFFNYFSSGDEVTAIELSIPGFSLNTPGAATAYNYFNNNDTKFYSIVEKIELVYRESQNDVWRLIQVYDVRAALNETFRYTGNSNSTPISDTDFTQIFDVVPFKAGTIEVIDNRFVFGDTLEEKTIAPTPQVTDVGVSSWAVADGNNVYWNRGNNVALDNAGYFSSMSAGDANELGLRNYISRTTFKGRGIYKLGIQWIAENGWRSAVYTTENWIYEIAEETGSIDKLYAFKFKFPSTFQPPDWAVAYQIVRTNCLNIDQFLFGPCNLVRALIDDNTGFTDELQIAQTTRDRIRQHFEDAREVTGTKFDNYLTVLKNKNFYKSIVSDVRKTAAAGAIADASRLYIDISNWYNSSIKNAGATQNNPLNNLYYNYREGEQVKLGDRVRFIASTNATPADNQKVIYDMPILEFSGRGIIVEKPTGILWLPGNSAQTDPKDMFIEVYSPRQAQAQDYLYHEVGEWYPVLYPGTSQRDMSKRDWTYTNNSAVTCTTYGDFRVYNNFPFAYGDCHQIEKTYYYDYQSVTGATSLTITNPSMVPDPNRTFDFWEYAIGRSYPAYTDFPVVKFKPTMVRFGGQIIDESSVNNINRFREEDSKIYPSEYGRIRALVNTQNAQVESVGAILLAIGERETFSIYVNRTTLEDLSGRSQVSLSDRVLGSYNTLLGSHGTLNPESISTDRGRVYYWDAIDGTWIRYGRDGLTEISFYKMRNWFRELGALLVTKYNGTTDPWVTSEFDPFNEELVTRIDHADLPATFRDYVNYKGSLFSEEDKRWKSCHTWAPEMFARVNTQLISFVAGTLYLHEQGPGYSTFYGVKQDVYIEPVATSKNMESWQNIAVTSTDKWSVERFLSEYRGTKSKRQSSLAIGLMDDVEDKYVAAIKNDANTTGGLIEGEKMRSRALRAMLKLDPSVVTESLLHYVDIDSIDSPKNP